MFCPKCSQQQISDEVRFCARCGFALGVVQALLTAEEAPPAKATGAKPARATLHKRDVTLGAFFMFAAGLLVSLLTIDMPPGSGARILALPVAWLAVTLLVNLAPLIKYFLHGESSATPRQITAAPRPELFKPASGSISPPVLNAYQGLPARDYLKPSRLATAEVIPLSSVTEPTTHLLPRRPPED